MTNIDTEQTIFKQVDSQALPRLNHFLKQHKEPKAGKGDLNFCLESNDRIIACARLIATEKTNHFWLRGVFVEESFRRQGLGNKLMEQIHLNQIEQAHKLIIYAFPLSHLDQFYSDLGYQHCDPQLLPDNLKTRYESARTANKGWLCMKIELESERDKQTED